MFGCGVPGRPEDTPLNQTPVITNAGQRVLRKDSVAKRGRILLEEI